MSNLFHKNTPSLRRPLGKVDERLVFADEQRSTGDGCPNLAK
jgi:hypothetical protein